MQKELHCYSQPLLDGIIDVNFREHHLNESIRYVIGNIINKIAIHKRMIQSNLEKGEKPNTDMDGAWIDCNFYATVIGKDRYTEVMQKLVDINILTKELILNDKNFHRYMPVYRLKNDLLMIGGSWKRIFSVKTKARINKYWESKLKKVPVITEEAEIDPTQPKAVEETKEFTIDMLVIKQMAINCDKIDLAYDQVNEILKNKYSSYIKKNPDGMTLDEYCNMNAPLCWTIIDKWNNSTLAERCTYYIVDKFGYRLHHVFTFLPKEFRHHIKDPNGRLITMTEMDMTACQSVMLCNKLVEMDPTFRTDPFIQLVEQYQLYEDIMTKTNTTDREEAKPILMRMMFCHRLQKDQEIFESFFPRVATFIKKNWKIHDEFIIKGGKKKRLCKLAMEIQREETRIFRPVWKLLLDNNLIFITCHDAVYIGNLDDVQKNNIHQLICDVISQFIKIKFNIKVTPELST